MNETLFNQEQLNRLSIAISKDVEDNKYDGGAIVVARKGTIGLHEGIGFANRAKKRPLKIDDVFNILSVTKAFTDVIILSLIEKGKLALTTPVTELIPELEGKDKKVLTVFHLITHTAGSPPVLFPVKADQMGNLDAIVKAICSLDLVMTPGQAVSYSPLWGHALLGEIIRRLDSRKRALRDIYQEDLFGPLGMNDTALGRRKDLSSRIVPIVAHDPDFGDMTGKDVEEHNDFITETAEIPWMGAVSTAYDLFRFAEMLRRGGELDGVRILSPVSVRQMTTVQTGDLVNDYYVRVMEDHDVQPPPANIGLDLLIRGKGISPNSMGTLTSPGTFGKFGLGGTGFWVDPDNEVTFVFLRSGLLEHYNDTVSYQRLSDMAIAAVV
ncbi:MAG: beta-lactamase family protein [Dehalococcoidales bacterium]|nr:beta-lactamase family protein [Dehalococcoidales bacterium]